MDSSFCYLLSVIYSTSTFMKRNALVMNLGNGL